MRQAGILVISHGSSDRDWVRLVDDAVGAMRLPQPVPVAASFLEAVEGRSIQDGIDRLEERGVTELLALPLFLSSGSTHLDEIGYALGVHPEPARPTDLQPFRLRAGVRLGRPIDADREIAEALWSKLRPLSAAPEKEVLLLVGHGSGEPGFREAWQACLDGLAGHLRRLGRFSAVETATMLPDTLAERMKRCSQAYPDRDVIVAPFFLSEGYFTRHVIPRRLDGFRYRYNGHALLPHPSVSRWMEKQAAAMLQALEKHV